MVRERPRDMDITVTTTNQDMAPVTLDLEPAARWLGNLSGAEWKDLMADLAMGNSFECGGYVFSPASPEA